MKFLNNAYHTTSVSETCKTSIFHTLKNAQQKIKKTEEKLTLCYQKKIASIFKFFSLKKGAIVIKKIRRNQDYFKKNLLS